MKIRKWWLLTGLAINIISCIGMLIGDKSINKVWLIPLAVGIIFIIASISWSNKKEVSKVK